MSKCINTMGQSAHHDNAALRQVFRELLGHLATITRYFACANYRQREFIFFIFELSRYIENRRGSGNVSELVRIVAVPYGNYAYAQALKLFQLLLRIAGGPLFQKTLNPSLVPPNTSQVFANPFPRL